MRLTYIWIGLGVLLLVLAVGVVGFWYLSMQPLYKPGAAARDEGLSAPLTPPQQPADGTAWLVEPGIALTHFGVGTGRNVLVIHGGPGLPFVQQMTGLEPLTDRFRFHYYAQRGSGDSTRPIERFESSNMYRNMQQLDRTLGLGAQIADIERIRQILGEEKLILIGHSWGGFLAALYAAEFPANVEAMILIAPANVLVMPQPDKESDLFASVRARLPMEQQSEFDEFMADYMDFRTLFSKSEDELVAMNERFGRYYGTAVAADVPTQGRSGGWMVWAQYVSMGQRHDYRKLLADVGAPTLVLHGAEDLQSEAASRLYVDALPNANFAVIQGAGHFAFEQQPEEFARIVAAFLERNESITRIH